jgi:nucleoside-diphosphate-sugar epimerase
VELLQETPALEVVSGDLADDPALRRLCDGADVVIHAAGLVKARRIAEFTTVNVQGSQRVAQAAANVPHTVLVSSLTAREPELSPYAASKHAAETVMAEALGSRLTIMRPCAIYGPRDRELLPIFQAADMSPILPLLGAEARITMVHVEDAAEQIAAIAGGAPSGACYSICDNQPRGYSWRELMTCAADACGRRPALIPTPDYVIQGLGFINELSRFFGASPMLTRAKARELLHRDWTISPDTLAPDAPPVRHTLATGFKHTVAWRRQAGRVKH